FYLEEHTYIMDTPGFSSLYLEDMEKEELKDYFYEFAPYEDLCRFGGCAHIGEPDCGVKEALSAGKISRVRYDNYVLLYQELKDRKKY
ncbi:MAG: ribosome small subunit-dependent GTPase A, partial [Acetivibrio ethanolgignens]